MLVRDGYGTNCITSGHDCNNVDDRHTPDRRQSKTLLLSTNVHKSTLETEQSKTLFLVIFDPRSLIV